MSGKHNQERRFKKEKIWLVIAALTASLAAAPSIATPLASPTVLSTITVSSSWSLAISPDGARLYALNTGTPHTISVVDAATETVLSTFTLPVATGTAYQPVLSPDGRKLYIPIHRNNPSAASLYVVDVSDDRNLSLEATVTLPVGAQGIDITPDGSKVYVANTHSNQVSVIDTSTLVVTTFGPFATTLAGQNYDAPYSVRVSPDGESYFAMFYKDTGGPNSGFSGVIQFNTSDDTIRNQKEFSTSSDYTNTSNIPKITNAAFSPDGRYLYLSRLDRDLLQKFDLTAGTFLDTAVWEENLYLPGISPYLIKVSGDGSTLYVAGSSHLRIIDSDDGDTIDTFQTVTFTSGLAAPSDTVARYAYVVRGTELKKIGEAGLTPTLQRVAVPSGSSVNTSAFTSAMGGTVTYSATGLPAGITLDTATGVLSGTLGTLPSDTSVTISATNGTTTQTAKVNFFSGVTASVTSGSSSGGSSGSATPIVIDVLPKKVTVSNEIVTLFGAGLEAFTGATVNGKPVRIEKITGNRITLRAPKGLSGTHDITLTGTNTSLLVPKGLTYGSKIKAGARTVVPGFAANSTRLTPAMKKGVKAFLTANPDLLEVVCKGFTSAPATALDRMLALNRGKVTCDLIKKLRPEATVTIRSGSHTDQPGLKIRRVQITLG